MTRVSRVVVVALAALALALVSLILLAWGGTIADDPAAPPPVSSEPPSTARPRLPTAQWSTAKVMRTLDGTRIRAGNRVVRIDSSTTLCSGEGTPLRRNGRRSWRAFHCTFTAFAAGLPARDVEFHVRPLGRRRFAVSDVRLVAG